MELMIILIIIQIVLLYFIIVSAKVLYRYSFDLPISILNSLNIFEWSRKKASSTSDSGSDTGCESFFRTQVELNSSTKCVSNVECASIAYKNATVPEEFCFTKALPGNVLERNMINKKKEDEVEQYLSYITGRQVNGYNISDGPVTCGTNITPLKVIEGTTGLFECRKLCEDNESKCTGFEFKPTDNTCKLIQGDIKKVEQSDTNSMCYVKMTDKERENVAKWIESPEEPVK